MGEQFGVGAGLGNLTFFEDDQTVHAGDGRKPVSDGNHGFTLHQGFETFLDRGFDFGVQRRGRFVHDQNRRILQ